MKFELKLKRKDAETLFNTLGTVLMERKGCHNYSMLVPKFVIEDGSYLGNISCERGGNHEEARMDNKSKIILTVEDFPPSEDNE